MARHITRKQRQLREQKAHASTGEDLKNAEQAPTSRFFDYLRGNGLGLILSGIAFFLTPYFQLGIGFFLIGSVLLANDIWKDVVIHTQKRIYRIGFVTCGTLYFVGFALWLLWPCSLKVSATSSLPKYGPGSNLYGIPWSDGYARLDFKIRNPSDVDYDNFDAEISTDLTFEGVKQIGGIESCAIAQAGEVIRPTSQRMVGIMPVGPGATAGGVPAGPVDTNPTQYTVVAIGKDGEELAFSGDTAKRYRIRCDKFPANSEFTFVAALSVVNPVVNGRPPEPLRGAARAAARFGVKAKLDRLGRPRSISLPSCQMGQDCMP